MVAKDLKNELKNDGFKICHSGQLVNYETRREIVKSDITPPQKTREKELHFGMQDEEYLNSSKLNMC